MSADRFGIGWRPRLAAGILSNLERLDIVEVIADDYFRADRGSRRALRTLAAQTRVTLHGVSLGMASAVPVETKRLDDMARLCDEVRPAFWSEHLAFVRGGGVEIGHLAAPPRCEATIDGALANLARAKQIVGIAPQVENVATLIDPPGSDRDEAAWISAIVQNSESRLLLDLHNLHANSLNFKFDAREFLTRIPTERIATIHLAGGKWIGRNGAQRLLDDHLHDVPDPVYELLAEVAARAPQPLTIILERDGNFPSIETLLVQLDRAREAVARGRALGPQASRLLTLQSAPRTLTCRRDACGPSEESLLARIYVDAAAREKFLADPRGEATRAGLAPHEIDDLANIDRDGLEMFAHSLEHKKAKHGHQKNQHP